MSVNIANCNYHNMYQKSLGKNKYDIFRSSDSFYVRRVSYRIQLRKNIFNRV